MLDEDMNILEAKYIMYMKNVIREYRHDYMNYFQIIYGYIQLGKFEEAINQIKNVININENLSKVYNLSLFNVSIFLDNLIRELSDLEYKVIFDITNHTEYDLRLIDNDKEILETLEKIFKLYLEDNFILNNDIFVKIEEFEDRISFLFVGENKITTTLENMKDIDIVVDEKGTNIVFECKNSVVF